MLVRVSITQEGNLFHKRLFMKIYVDDRSRMDKITYLDTSKDSCKQTL